MTLYTLRVNADTRGVDDVVVVTKLKIEDTLCETLVTSKEELKI